MKLFIAIAICFSFQAFSQSDGSTFYEEKIYALESQGHLNKIEAQNKIYELRLRDAEDARLAKERARGVASAISNKKIIKIANDPINVSVSLN